MTDEMQSQAPAMDAAPQPSAKGGSGKIVIAVVIAAVVVAAVIAAALLMGGPGIAGKWNVVSVKSTLYADGNETISWDNSTGNWVEFKSDGTGVNNAGDTFSWEASDGRITITDDTNDAFGTMGVPFDYTLDGNEMTIRGMFAAGLYMVFTLERA